jgi:chemotaxis protein methyltransferase CheR
MGQEAYSLAMVFAESMGRFAFRNVRIYATDLDGNDQFAEIVRSGVYPEEELKRMPVELFAKYFEPMDGTGRYRISEVLRNVVSFQKHDLLSLKSVGEGFSLVLCKNVLLHFQHAERVEVMRMFHKALAPGGFMATEQTQKLPSELSGLFEQVTPDAQVFRKL